MSLVLDAQPLLSLFLDEPGADAAQEALEAAGEDEDVLLNAVNLAEVGYILRRAAPEMAPGILGWVQDVGVGIVDAKDVWRDAAEVKADHPIPLADAFALATARSREAPLLAGDDPHFDVGAEVGVEVRRVTEAA